MNDRASVIAGFFARLQSLEEILRIITSRARLRAALTFRAPEERSVVLDLRSTPLRVLEGTMHGQTQVRIAVDADVMHEVLIGALPPGEALGRRHLLLRGSPHHLARFIPLLDFAPVLYREHLALEKRAMNQSSPSFAVRAVNGLAYAMGYVVGLLRYRVLKSLNLFEVLSSMSRGLEASTPKVKR